MDLKSGDRKNDASGRGRGGNSALQPSIGYERRARWNEKQGHGIEGYDCLLPNLAGTAVKAGSSLTKSIRSPKNVGHSMELDEKDENSNNEDRRCVFSKD